MAKKALTQVAISNFKPELKRREIPDGKISGLFLIIQPTGAMSWAVRYRANGVSRKHTIGPYPAIDLSAARRAAQKALSEVAEGKDPASQKRAAREAARAKVHSESMTVARVVEQFIERHAKAKNKSWRETERLLHREVVSRWGNRPITSIARAEIHDLLDATVDRGTPIVANRVLAALRKLFNWATERGIVVASPCEKIRAPAPERKRDRILSDMELRQVWNACDGLGYPFGPIVRLLILTGQRREEVAQMTWEEVDITAKTWTIPKSRAKNFIEHHVPLSEAVIDLLIALPRAHGSAHLVFTTTGSTPVSGFSKAKQTLDGLILKAARDTDPHAAAIAAWVIHDLRRTMASGMARLGINLPVIEKVLNHVSGSFAGIVGVYQRYSFADEKRAALQAWTQHIESITCESSPEPNINSIKTGNDNGTSSNSKEPAASA